MSLDRHIYLGPYAEWKVRLVEKEINKCPFPKECPNPTSGFCPKCGMDTKKQYRLRRSLEPNIDIDEITEGALRQIFDSLERSADKDREKTFRLVQVLPNVERPGRPDERPLYIDDYVDVLDIEDGKILLEEVFWFLRAFRKELDTLTSAYGSPPISKWGFLQWYS